MADVTMPQLGETVTEGTVTRWFKKVGDKVGEDEPLFEVSTDKVDSEVPSATSGYVAEILVQEGETVDVGARLAVITQEAPSGGDGDSDGAASAPPSEPDTAAEVPDVEAAADDGAADDGAADDGAADDGAADGGAPQPESQPKPEETGPRRVLSPVVRRLLAENDLDPDQIEGTGRGGRITRDDVLASLDRGAADGPARAPSEPARRRPPAAAPAADAPGGRPAAATAATAAPAPGQGDEVVPFSNIRRRTAEHMIRSQATAAHVLTATEVDFAQVDRARLAERERFKAEEGFSLTYLPFVARAVIDAVRDFPHVNASVGDNELIVHRQVHLGFAVDLSFEGLIVPVIHDADSKRLRPIARELADLAARARSKKLNADEIAGGTFTITNPGSYGTLITAPVINQPQVAIVSTDGVKKRPVVVELPDGSDAVAIHPVGTLAMSFDHRAFDGAYASAFLARCRQILETRDWSQEL